MQRHHRHINPPFELEDRSQFQSHPVLHDVKNGLFVRATTGDVRITFFARDKNQTEGLYFLSERFVIHRFKPIHDVIYVFEIHNDLILPDRIPRMQILPENRGNPSCPA